MMKLGGNGLEGESSIVDSGREALKDGRALITLLHCWAEERRTLNTLLGGSFGDRGIEGGDVESGSVESGGGSIA